MSDNLSLVPRLPAPWVIMDGPSRGQPTPPFYRFILSLLDLSGGSTPTTLIELESLFFAQPQASPASVSNLQGEVQRLGALIASFPNPPPNLTQAVEKLTAIVMTIPTYPDLTSRVEALEALVFASRLAV